VDRVVGDVPRLEARGWVRQAVTGGIVAGLVGAVVLALVRLALGIGVYWVVWRIVGSRRAYPVRIAGRLIWAAVKLPAYAFVGERALDPGFDASVVLLGIVSHLVLSIGWGVLFALVAHGLSRRATIALGFLWGGLMWFVSYHVILPLVRAAPLPDATPGTVFVFLPCGVAMAFTLLWWQRRAGQRKASS
jgi:hypothetical protein